MVRRFFRVLFLAVIATMAIGYCLVNDFVVPALLIWGVFAVSMFLNGRAYGWFYVSVSVYALVMV